MLLLGLPFEGRPFLHYPFSILQLETMQLVFRSDVIICRPPVLQPLDMAPEVPLTPQPSPPPVDVPVQKLQIAQPVDSPQPSPHDVADPRPGPAVEFDDKGPKPVHFSHRILEEFLRYVTCVPVVPEYDRVEGGFRRGPLATVLRQHFPCMLLCSFMGRELFVEQMDVWVTYRFGVPTGWETIPLKRVER
jgi:hypothetical protein